jgi:hypothetical protein
MDIPDQIHDPDLSEISTYAEAFLLKQINASDDEEDDGINYKDLIAEEVLRAFYGPNFEDLISELRSRNADQS